MAYASCAAKIAANIQQDCNRPLIGGYTGRAVIMSALDFERAEVVRSATNPRKILSVVLPPDGSVMAYTINNVFAAPFSGSTTAGNNESGRNGYLKTVNVRVPMRGADTSMKVIEPLVKSPDGFVAILEKRDKVGDGSYEIIGYQNTLRGDITGVTRDENANGGDWIVPMKTTEKWAEVDLVGAAETYDSAKKEFEGMLYFEPMVMRMTTSVVDQEFAALSANGLVYIDSVKSGVKVRKKIVSPNAEFVTIENDADTEIIVWGKVTLLDVSDNAITGLTSLDVSKNTMLEYLACGGCTGLTSLDVSKNTMLTNLACWDCTGLTSLDVSKNTMLTFLACNGCAGLTALDVRNNTDLRYLDCNACTSLPSLNLRNNTSLAELYCSGCTGLTSLDVSKNTMLTHLDLRDCTGLMLLDIQNTKELEDGTILDQSMANLTTLQVAGTSAWAYEQVEGWLSDFAPDNGIIYVDENTPQGVITEAEGKSWEVIYVS